MDWKVARDNAALEAMLKPCLRKRERVMLLLPGGDPSLGDRVRDTVTRCGGVPTLPDGKPLWSSLLKQGFAQRIGCAVGEPGVLLGLSKLSQKLGIPLYIRNCIAVGALEDYRMAETIRTCLDCTVAGVYCPETWVSPPDPAPELSRLLRRWTSVLDFRLENTPSGLSLEMVTFPGEKLPKLPALAKLVVRPWKPDSDCPFALSKPNFSSVPH